jgi:hypothetical protein
MIKTKKIVSGFYKGFYKGITFNIVKTTLPKNEIAWYWQIGNSSVHDLHSSKAIAINAVMDYIDYSSK